MSDSARRGWSAPKRPGPTRATVIRCVLVGLVLVVAGWLYGARILERRHLDDRTERITQPAPATPATKRIYARGADRWVAQEFALRSSVAARVVVTVATPSELDPSAVSIRARSSDARVRLRRNGLGEPVADLQRLGARGVVHVLIVRPATPQEMAFPAARNAPQLTSITHPFDARASSSQAAARTLDRAQGAASWLLPLLVLLAVGVPLVLQLWLRRRWFGQPVPAVVTATLTGPPGTGAALTAALATRGTRAIDVGDAFAAQVLELVEAGTVDARRAIDPSIGPALMLRIARRPETAPNLAQAALDVLDVHTAGGSTSLLVPDSRRRAGAPGGATDPAARPRAAARWRSALVHAQATSRQVETPRWKWWLRAGQLLSLAMFVLVV
ncbi:MAG: hypothetical protein H7287_10655, partial [Thermoleophilia bacterium]|nr:hypothetical protein [Thermoleophilia bacterium]